MHINKKTSEDETKYDNIIHIGEDFFHEINKSKYFSGKENYI